MPLINPKNRREEQREAALQERLRLSVERPYARSLARIFDNYAKRSARAYADSGSLQAALNSLDRMPSEIGRESIAYLGIMVRGSVERVEDELGKSIRRFEQKRSAENIIDSIMKSWLMQHVFSLSKTVSDTMADLIRGAVADGVAEGEGEAKIAELIIEASGGMVAKQRARMIARTESHTASQTAINVGVSDALGSDIDMRKKWVPVLSARTRDSHEDMYKHEPVPMDGLFRVARKGGHDQMAHPGDARGSAANVVNCRCVLTYKSVE